MLSLPNTPAHIQAGFATRAFILGHEAFKGSATRPATAQPLVQEQVLMTDWQTTPIAGRFTHLIRASAALLIHRKDHPVCANECIRRPGAFDGGKHAALAREVHIAFAQASRASQGPFVQNQPLFNHLRNRKKILHGASAHWPALWPLVAIAAPRLALFQKTTELLRMSSGLYPVDIDFVKGYARLKPRIC